MKHIIFSLLALVSLSGCFDTGENKMNYNVTIYLTTNNDNISYTVKDISQDDLLIGLANGINGKEIITSRKENGFIMVSPQVIKYIDIKELEK